MAYRSSNTTAEVLGAGAALLGAFTFFALWIASWVTHVIVCINHAAWILLIIGILVPPIGWIHGVAVWFGWA